MRASRATIAASGTAVKGGRSEGQETSDPLGIGLEIGRDRARRAGKRRPGGGILMPSRNGKEGRMKRIEITPIGEVRADDSRGRYELEIAEPYRKGLKGLSEFGRVQVLWWAHGVEKDPAMRETLVCELPYAKGERAGVFACRAQYRPNPVDLSSCGVVELREKEGVVVLDYIDAVDGTPIVDIKPYIPVCDRARDIKVAPWFRSWPEWIEDAGAFFSSEEAPRTS
jgi:tRNA (adenine37-N6)-methyltransferase